MATLLELPRFFVNQKARLFELSTEFKVMDENGTQVAMIRQEGQSAMRKLIRAVTKLDQFLTHRLGIYDVSGAPICQLTRPAAIMKSRVQVADASGAPVGSIVQKNIIGKIRFGLEGPSGEEWGAISAENWRAWNFTISDQTGSQVGAITKKWAGIGKELFTTADNYMVEISESVQGPQRLLLVAAASGIDIALKQNEG